MCQRWFRIVASVVLWLGLSGPGQARSLHIDAVQVLESATGEWQAQALPDDWAKSRPEVSGQVRYRVRFDADELWTPTDVPVLYIRRVCSNAAVSLNGTLVGTGGRMTLPYTRNCFVPQLFTLPIALMRAKDNELVVDVVGYPLSQVSANQRSSGLSELVLGPLSELKTVHDEALWWGNTLPKIIAAVLGVFTVFISALWLARPQETYFGYFSLWIGWWTLNTTRLFVVDPPLAGPWVEMLVPATAPVCVLGLLLFMMRYAGRNVVWVNRVLWGQMFAIPLVFLAAGWDHIHSVARLAYGVWLVPQFVLGTVWFLYTLWRTARRDFWLFALIFVGLVVVTLLELAAALGLLPLKAHLGHLAGPVTLLPICLRLIWVFTDSLKRVEQINAELEQRVTEKSHEIERSYAELSDLRLREAARQERQRIASDLHDDLGAKLLTIARLAQAPVDDPDRVPRLARQALDDMRMSVRGLTTEAGLLGNAVADWRAETVERLREAGLACEWHASELPAAEVLPSRVHVQLTRVLRESVSNAIRHSGADRCRVSVGLDAGWLTLSVEDNGRGLPPDAAGGHGLPNIERRARQLGGTHSFTTGVLGGLCVWVKVPMWPEGQVREVLT